MTPPSCCSAGKTQKVQGNDSTNDNKEHPHAVTTVQKQRKRFCSSPPKPWKPCNNTGNNVEKHTMRLQLRVAETRPMWKIFKSVCVCVGGGTGGRTRLGDGRHFRTYHLSFSSEWLKGGRQKNRSLHHRRDSPLI